MLRRTIDTAIPGTTAVAVSLAVFGSESLPGSVANTMGEYGRAWAGVVFATCVAVVVGVWIRKRDPSRSFGLELAGCVGAGFFSSMYGVSVLFTFGPVIGWIALWYSIGISLYYLSRSFELLVSRWHAVKAARGRDARSTR